jgi:hypothetical protein
MSPSAPRTILFVTGNANKLREVKAILLASTSAQSDKVSAATPSFNVESQDLDLPEVQGSTREVATEKVRAAAAAIGGPCITEVRFHAFLLPFPFFSLLEETLMFPACSPPHRTPLSPLKPSVVFLDLTSSTL